jgi:hypothetical protein
MGLVFLGTTWGQEESRRGEIRGAFVRLTEQRVDEREYLGVVVRLADRDDHVTLLVPRQNEPIVSRARGLQGGQKLEAVYVLEEDHRWITELVAIRPEAGRREPGQRRDPGEIERLHARVERLERTVRELRAEIRELRAELREKSSVRREIEKTVRREGEEGRVERGRPKTEREVVLEQLEAMRMAMPALREAERADAADSLRLAIRSREMMLEGRRDEEARNIRERAPNRAQLAEILALAARLWREFGHAEKSVAIERLAEQLAARERGRVSQRSERSAQEREAVHVTVRPTEAGETEVFFRERRVSIEQLRGALQDVDERRERLLVVHARGAVSEELVRSIAETAEDLVFGRIKVEHIKRKRDR